MSAPAIAARSLVLELAGRQVVDVGSLELHEGEVLALVGQNGAGKSSLLSLLALLQRPTAGTIHFDGRRVDDLVGKARLGARRRMACVFQQARLLDRTVLANVELGLRLRGVSRSERSRRATKAMKLLGIEGLCERPALSVSGGEARRIAIARALAIAPEVLLLDEPFAGLDSVTRRRLLKDTKGLLSGKGRSTVLVTHDREEALALADRIAVLVSGELRQIGAAEEVVSHPVDAECAAALALDDTSW